MWKYGWDEPCGGFWWTNCDDQMFKDSITIVEVLHFASKLSYMFSNESRYLRDATKNGIGFLGLMTGMDL